MKFVQHGDRVQLKRAEGVRKQTRFLKQGLGEEAATSAALEEAKAKREELVHQGKMLPAKPVAAKASSVRGVDFDKKWRKWRVRFTDPIIKKSRQFGSFDVQEEAEARARELAKEFGLQAESELVPVQKLSELPRFQPCGPERGIIWRVPEQCWYADGRFHGIRRQRRFTPKDCSESEVKRAWAQAVEWYKRHEQSNAM